MRVNTRFCWNYKRIFKKTCDSKYNFQRRKPWASRFICARKYDIESISYVALKIWSLVPNVLKNFRDFRSKIKNWKTSNFPFKLYKVYMFSLLKTT